MTGPGRQRGFTLIELVIAVAIGAVVLLSSYTLLFAVKRGTTGLYDRMRQKEAVINLLSMMRKEAEGIYFSNSADYSGLRLEERDLYGRPASRLAFTSFFRDGLKVVSYGMEEDRDGRINLVKTIADPVRGGKPVVMVLLRDVEGFSVRVLDEGFDRVYDSSRLRKLPKDLKVTVMLKGGEKGEAYSQICSLMLTDAL